MILLCLESRNGHPIPPTFINKPGSLSKHPLESVHAPLPASLERDSSSQKMVELAKNNTDTTDVEIGDDIPFGENSADSMQGSPTFPSLKIDTGSLTG